MCDHDAFSILASIVWGVKVLQWTQWHYAGRVNRCMAFVVVRFYMRHIHGLTDTRNLIQLTYVAANIGVTCQ